MKKAKEEMQREMEVQKKLRNMRVYCQGFAWIKQTGGYRCAGGSHFISDDAIGVAGR